MTYNRITGDNTMIKTLKREFNHNVGHDIIRAGYKSGRRQLINNEGYKPCNNPAYVENDDTIIHYNNFMKIWIVENKGLNRS